MDRPVVLIDCSYYHHTSASSWFQGRFNTIPLTERNAGYLLNSLNLAKELICFILVNIGW